MHYIALAIVIEPFLGLCYCSLAHGTDIGLGYATLPQSPAVLNATAPFPRTGCTGALARHCSFVPSRPSAQLDGILRKRKSILGDRFFVICAINVPAAGIGDTCKLN